MSELFVVAGASGNVGSIVATRLLDAGKKVRVIARNADHLKRWTDRGAEAAVGSLEDADFVTRAMAGATAAYVLVPPNMSVKGFRAYQNRVAASLVRGVQSAKVGHVITLSSIGAHLPRGNGPVAGLHDMERAFGELSSTNVLHLRPTYFMENHLGSIGAIKQMGMIGGAMKPDLLLPMIATRDIGEVATQHLLARDFKGHWVRELLGPRDISMNDVAKAFGAAIGKPDLKYTQFPYEDAKKAMMGMGIPEEMAGLYMEMTRGFNDGIVTATQPRSPTTQTPTTIEEFARTVFAGAFKAS
ncbi:MAG: NAD(P)H-binding protein [Deltaproteobacteria bacterium]|nr:NAD(P)H-binding protein [Deltaproteobacteria bacterium]